MNRIVSLIGLLLILLIIGCEGPIGPQGKQGPQGEPGEPSTIYWEHVIQSSEIKVLSDMKYVVFIYDDRFEQGYTYEFWLRLNEFSMIMRLDTVYLNNDYFFIFTIFNGGVFFQVQNNEYVGDTLIIFKTKASKED